MTKSGTGSISPEINKKSGWDQIPTAFLIYFYDIF